MIIRVCGLRTKICSCQSVSIHQGDISYSSDSIYVPNGGRIMLDVMTYDDSLY